MQARHLSSGCRFGQEIALTFDDGPDPQWTPQVLQALQSRQARATFFLEGEEAAAQPALVRALVDAGMVVGSHSNRHDGDMRSWPAGAIEDDLSAAEEAIFAASGRRTRLFRFPYGRTSPPVMRVLRRKGYVSVGWNIDGRDWYHTSAADIATRVLAAAKPGGIVDMHDGALGASYTDRSDTVAALPAIIDGLRERGFTLVTLDELLGVAPYEGVPAPAPCNTAR